MIVQTFEIPIPPSANRMYRTAKGRTYTSKGYASFINTLGWWLNAQRIQRQPGPVRFSMAVQGGKGWRISADIDNRIKPTLDGLVKNGILEDDSTKHIKQKHIDYIERASRQAVCRFFVRLEEPGPSWFDGFNPPPQPLAAGGNHAREAGDVPPQPHRGRSQSSG